MTTILEDAQREVRDVYLHGSVGQLVSGALWLASAALATWGDRRAAIWLLVLGGAGIFPLTQLLLRLAGRTASLGAGNPLRWLAMQTAFIVPLTLPVVGGATLHRIDWFYPGCMIVVGAHYLPFVTLYGMRAFAALGGALIAVGILLGTVAPLGFTTGGWLTAAALLAFAGWAATRREGGLRSEESRSS